MISPQDTITAIATPLGKGGLGVIRVSGTQAIQIVSKLFRKHTSSSPAAIGRGSMDSPPETAGNDVLNAPSHTCLVGFIVSDSIIDQVVITLFRAPHSYTGDDVVEIAAHGNPLTLRKILNLCLQKGARLAEPGEFTQRAFLNGKIDLTQAEAVAELIHAKSDKSQAAALAQMRGGLAQEVRKLRDRLLPLLAHVEVSLDHAEEGHEILSRAALLEGCRGALAGVEALLASARVGKILREGLRVAFLGKPNVGKSSLLNALLKEDRAIVTATPGTTRDTLEETVHWNGLPVVLTDTAGLRQDSQDPIEKIGMERTRRSLETADVVIGLFDGSEALCAEDRQVIQEALAKPHVWVINKSDLPQRLTTGQLDAFNGKAPVVNLSAKTGEGLEQLVQTLSRLALEEKAQASEAQWLLNARHQAALETAKASMARATTAAETEFFEECIALELQTALHALGEIIGETTTEELLGQIFSTFCIGK